MRRTLAVIGFSAVLAGIVGASLLLPETARSAAPSRADGTFIIPANDGYGVADCLTGGRDCGQVIADAYCEAQGFVRAASFGPAAVDETTGTVETVATVATGDQAPIAIVCKK